MQYFDRAHLHEETDPQDLQRQRHLYEEAQAVVIFPQHTARQQPHHQHVQYGGENHELDAVGQQGKPCVIENKQEGKGKAGNENVPYAAR